MYVSFLFKTVVGNGSVDCMCRFTCKINKLSTTKLIVIDIHDFKCRLFFQTSLNFRWYWYRSKYSFISFLSTDHSFIFC